MRAERQAVAEAKRVDEIVGVIDIRSAVRLAKDHNPPIFLYTGNGRTDTAGF